MPPYTRAYAYLYRTLRERFHPYFSRYARFTELRAQTSMAVRTFASADIWDMQTYTQKAVHGCACFVLTISKPTYKRLIGVALWMSSPP